jgi:PiT family inorganic phosphate transporter
LFSSAAYSLSHGLNDAQKTMGIITVLLYSTGHLSGEFEVPHWVAISCYVAIAWIITIPASAAVGALFYSLTLLF